MKTLRRMVSNALISIVGQIITWSSTLVLMICYGRFLGDVKFGELYTATTFVLLVGFPLDVGFTQQVIRDVAQEPDKAQRYLWNTLSIKLLFWPLIYGVILVASWLLGYNMEVRILMAIAGLTILSSAIGGTFSALYYAFEQMTFPVLGSILEKGLSALIGWFILKRGAGVEAMACVLLVGSLLNTLVQAGCFFARVRGIRLSIDFALIRKLLHTCVPFVLYGVLGIIYYRIDAILLSLMEPPAVIGWYGAGYRLFDTLTFLSGIIMTVTYPVLIKLSSNSEESLQLGIEKAMNMLLFCSIPITCFLIFAASFIVGFLYHRDEFVHTIPALQGLAPGLVLLYANALLSNTIVTIKKEQKTPIIALIALIFNLGLNFLLIPLYQHVGAAIVTSLTELLILCLQCTLIPRHLLPLRSWRVGLKALIASLAMGAAIWLVDISNVLTRWPAIRSISVFIILLIAILTYLGVALLLRTIPREDMVALYTAFRKQKVA
ncbi:flippase [Ktedonosporobacter rubrisoli]|uniref:Flippase n=1 Tax=Ktedonosporobacter rubrisoli TaxID=2509675 RepID=A0A4V0Z0H6_KTERU|nr:flippase [Ktedonosporobacter rubrisoli]QBD83251.1 flippase [Ktedonosporobacter rubrisoli]